MAVDLAASAFDTTRAECPADAVAITPAGGAAVVGLALVLDKTVESAEAGLGRVSLERLTILVQQAEFAAVAAGTDIVTLDGRVYQISRVDNLRALWRLELVREVTAERSNEELRGQR
jgi:hypothetical protein